MSYIENFAIELRKRAQEDSDDSKYLAFGKEYFDIVPVIRGPDFSKMVVQVKRFENELLMECRREIESKCAQEEMAIHDQVGNFKQRMKRISTEMKKKRQRLQHKHEILNVKEILKDRQNVERRRIAEMVKWNRETLENHKQSTEKFEQILNRIHGLHNEMELMAKETSAQYKNSLLQNCNFDDSSRRSLMKSYSFESRQNISTPFRKKHHEHQEPHPSKQSSHHIDHQDSHQIINQISPQNNHHSNHHSNHTNFQSIDDVKNDVPSLSTSSVDSLR